jgi:accessory colonization factor AcfC
MSKVDPRRPAIHARPGVWDTAVVVIGVVDGPEQDKVIAILRDIQARLAKKPIRVRFYREEVLTVTDVNPSTGKVLGWHREEKGLLREERIP